MRPTGGPASASTSNLDFGSQGLWALGGLSSSPVISQWVADASARMQAAALSLTPPDLSAQLARGVLINPGTLLRVAQWFRLEVKTAAADQVQPACALLSV